MAKALVRQPLYLKFPASSENVTEARHSIEDYARSLGMADVDDVALAVSEAAGNAVRHAYRFRDSGTIELRAGRWCRTRCASSSSTTETE